MPTVILAVTVNCQRSVKLLQSYNFIFTFKFQLVPLFLQTFFVFFSNVAAYRVRTCYKAAKIIDQFEI